MSDAHCFMCGDPEGPEGLHFLHEFGCDDPNCTCDLRVCAECCPVCAKWGVDDSDDLPEAAVTRCRSCDARVIWMQTTGGKSVMVDAEDMGGWDAPSTFDNGNLRRTGDHGKDRFGRSVPIVEYVTPGAGQWQAHFASCPDADKWRKRR